MPKPTKGCSAREEEEEKEEGKTSEKKKQKDVRGNQLISLIAT
jgi:hypothetical protein